LGSRLRCIGGAPVLAAIGPIHRCDGLPVSATSFRNKPGNFGPEWASALRIPAHRLDQGASWFTMSRFPPR
jgi:hypothetical protein